MYSKISYILLLLLLSGCSNKESREPPGKYTANFLGSTDTLIINPNGTYEHFYIFENIEHKNTGKWEVEYFPFAGETGLTFYNFTFRDWTPENHRKVQLKPPGIWHVKPDYSLIYGIMLCFGDDSDWCFKKIRSR